MLFASNFAVEEGKRNLFHPEQKKRLEDYLSEVQIMPEVGPSLPRPIELAEKDRPVLMAAISIKADYLTTGDSTHLGEYFGQTVIGVKICRPRDYLTKPLGKKK
jgi:predicted nucleic acid-binding protein